MTALEHAMVKIMIDVVTKHNGSAKKAADELGISEKTIRNYAKKYKTLKDAVRDQRPLMGNEKWKR